MKLYYAPNTRSTRPRWLLEEIGEPYELSRVDMARGEHKQPAHLAIHPLGRVPALVDGEVAIFESAAICMYLADKFPDRELAPPVGTPERGHYYQWMVNAMSEVEPAVAAVHYHTTGRPEAERIPAVAEEGRRKFAQVAAALDAALAGREFLLGARFSAADVMMGSVLGWGKVLGLLDGHPILLDYFRRLAPRPAFKRARAD